MHLQTLKLASFKNYDTAEIHFSEKINCFVGRNGAGKTNLLDAIYYLSFCKSYFNANDQQNIRHEDDFFTVHGYYQRPGMETDQVSCIQKRRHKKVFQWNKKTYDRLADHIGKIPLVMISPYDRDLINDGSELRRKFIDGVIAQFNPVYLDALLKYNKALSQRNALLKQFAEQRKFDRSMLLLWEEQMLQPATTIHQYRKEFLNDFQGIFQQYYTLVSGGNESVSIQYDSDLNEQGFSQLLDNKLERDRMARFTTVGVHKDDLNFLMNDFPVKRFGSQGQQKSFVIAIRLAQYDFTQKMMGYKPILLLDDIFDKLDDQRVKQLIKLVGEDYFGQVFLTDTQQHRVDQLFEESEIDHRIFEIDSGKIVTETKV